VSTVLIRIGANGDGWRVDLFHEDGREDWLLERVASEPLRGRLGAFEPPPLQGGRSGFDAIRAVVLEQDEDSGDFYTIGAHLHDVLARGEVGAAWARIVERESGFGRREGVRLLLDVQPEQLRMLPWELMCRGPRRLAADVANPFARVTPGYPGAGGLPLVRWPLRVLVVVGSRENDRVVEAEQEIAMLTDAFRRMCGLVAFELLPQPSRDLVQERYKALRPHIFHFIGHGSVEDDEGRLELFDVEKGEQGENEPWTAAKISADLSGWQPRLAILNACRSADAGEQKGAWGVAEQFRSLGIPAVIAMQADIRGDAAAAFTGGLYRALAGGEPLDVAVAAGRAAIMRRVDERHRDFALPSLSVSAPPDTVLKLGYGVDDELRPRVESVHPRFKAFVDRTHERRTLSRGLDPDDAGPEETPPAPLTAIFGGSKVGKSELARWCVSACELHGGNAAYVDLNGYDRLSFIPALCAIRDALGESALHGRDNLSAFETWNDATEDLQDLDGRAPSPADVLDTVFSYFGDALRQAAGDGPLLVALDHVGKVQEDHWTLICDRLLRTIGTHELAPVRVIVVLSAQEQRDGWLTEKVEPLRPPHVELAQFEAKEFKLIAGQYIRYHFDVRYDVVDDQLKLLKLTDRFNWEQVAALEMLAPSLGWEKFS
jgi:hypothetical protein